MNLCLFSVCLSLLLQFANPFLAGKVDINLNGIKSRIAKKLKMSCTPKLVDIIAAIPEEYKPVLLPKIRAKPVRTASGNI